MYCTFQQLLYPIHVKLSLTVHTEHDHSFLKVVDMLVKVSRGELDGVW